jgi:hypothetical protein
METTIKDTTQDEEKLYISGTTSWSDGTHITLKLDPDNYVLPADIKAHTWNIMASGPVDTYREFAIDVPLDKTQLSVGPHQIIATVDKNGYTSESYFDFMISDIYVMPTPTPRVQRMIYGKEYENIPVKVEPIAEPTVTETEEIVVVTPNVTAAISVPIPTATAKPTSNLTTVPTANQTIPTIPVSAGTIVAAVGLGLVARRGL